ncbi:putative paraoxonase [Xylaria digitata]|nr:putative paraoxonase [Xylaria digitata]
MAFKAALGVIALALLSPFIYERGQVSFLFWKNAPHRLVKVNTFASHEVRFSDRIRSCEDALMVESEGLAILGCDPGRERWNTVMGIFLPGPIESGKLYIFNYKDAGLSDDEALKQLEFVDFKFQNDFHTLGMAYDESTSTLFVASHRHDYPAIEMFKLDLEAYTATHLRSIQHALIHGPNSIVLINDHEFYVTNDHHFLIQDYPILNRVETNLGLPGGSIVHVDISPTLKDPEAPVQASIVARLSFANGIELLNDTTAVVASSAKAAVYFFSVSKPESNTETSSLPKFTPLSKLRVPFAPDNLSVSKDGGLIIAGHPHVPSLGKFAKTRHICNSPEELAKADVHMQETCQTISAPSWAARWTEAGGLENMYTDVEYPSSATAVRDSNRKMGVISGLYAKGIFLWKE